MTFHNSRSIDNLLGRGRRKNKGFQDSRLIPSPRDPVWDMRESELDDTTVVNEHIVREAVRLGSPEAAIIMNAMVKIISERQLEDCLADANQVIR